MLQTISFGQMISYMGLAAVSGFMLGLGVGAIVAYMALKKK